MSRDFSIFFILLFFPLVIGMASCSKQQGAATPAEIIIGKWKLVQYALDDNNNGTIEDSEKHQEPSWHVQELTFNTDGTGVETDVAMGVSESPQPFVYIMDGNDYMTVEYAAHDTLTYYLLSINSSNLILTTSSNSAVLQWYNYAKQ